MSGKKRTMSNPIQGLLKEVPSEPQVVQEDYAATQPADNPVLTDPFMRTQVQQSKYDYNLNPQDVVDDKQYDTGAVGEYVYGAPKVITAELRKFRQERVAERKQEDRQKVTARFINHEVRGGSTRFMFRKYKDEPIRIFEFKDGNIYKIDLGLMDHVNKTCVTREHAYSEAISNGSNNIFQVNGDMSRARDVQLKKPDYTTQYNPRYEFIPVNVRNWR